MSAPQDREQSFLSHLVELRQRLIKALAAVVLVTLVLLPFAKQIYTLMSAPMLAQLPEGATMIAVQIAAPFLTPFKMTLLLAVFLSMPIIIYQLWAFVAPGLYQHEKRITIPVLISSCLLLYLGCAFAYFVVFPLAFLRDHNRSDYPTDFPHGQVAEWFCTFILDSGHGPNRWPRINRIPSPRP